MKEKREITDFFVHKVQLWSHWMISHYLLILFVSYSSVKNKITHVILQLSFLLRVLFGENQNNQVKAIHIPTNDNSLIIIQGVEAQELSNGSHMYLFAIRLPEVNYPPSMHDSPFGRRIHYTLQGILDTTTNTPHLTAIVPIIYLPLITCNPTTLNQTSKKTQVFEKEDKKIEVTAELIKPAYCPGKT